LTAPPHVAADELYQIDGSRHVRIDYVTDVVEVLVEESMSKPMSGVGEQGVHRLSSGGGPQLIDPLGRGEVSFDDSNLRREVSNALSSGMNLRPIGGDQQVKAFLGANGGEFQADARRGAGHDCEWFAHRSPSSGISIGSALT
jgi:hypothetical protein